MSLGLTDAFVVLTLVGTASCQCFVPVEEFDGGDAEPVAGGPGGGASGEGGPALFDGGTCVSATACRGTNTAAASLCPGLTGSWSCAFNACVFECSGGRQCDSADAGCLTCDSATVCSQQTTCPWLTHLSFERSTCGRDGQLWQTRPTSEPCTRTLVQPDGGIAGTIWGYGYGALRADIPALGGSCVGVGIASGLVRFSLSCPACFALVRPEIIGP